MLSLYVCNLIIPGDPDVVTLTTPAGPWQLIKMLSFAATKSRITSTSFRSEELPIGETYFLQNVLHDRCIHGLLRGACQLYRGVVMAGDPPRFAL